MGHQADSRGFALAPDMLPQLAAEFARRRYLGATPRAHALTERECDVVIAVAEGLSNVAIASRLGLESSTVKTHMSHIAKKTSCVNRVQIAIWAYRHGLVGSDESAPDLGAARAEL